MAFGLTLAFFSVMTLGILVNWIAGGLLAFTIFFYVVIYTMLLKRWTAQNIVIGGAAGALPRWWPGPRRPVRCRSSRCCCSDHLLLDPAAFLGAGAVPQRRLCAGRGANAPGCRGADATRLQILLYTIVLVAVAVAPWPLGYFDAIYGVTSLVLGAAMLALAINVYYRRERSQSLRANRKAVHLLHPLPVRAVATLLLEVVVRAIVPLVW